MRALVGELTSAGFGDVRTWLQSGNFVFTSSRTKPVGIESRIEDLIAHAFSLRTDVFVRAAAEWLAMITGNPFPNETIRDPSRVTLLVLKEPPVEGAWRVLQQSLAGPELIRGSGTHGYVVYPDGIGRSHLTPTRIERALGTRSTTRNWNTVTKLGEFLPR